MKNETIMGIIAFILGIIILIFPFASDLALSVVFGIAFIILGIYYFILGGYSWKLSKGMTATYIILAILSIICGGMIFFNVVVFDLFVSIYFYVFGFMLLISGFVRLFQPGYKNSIAVLTIILGILTVFLGYFAMISYIYVAIIIGIGLIVNGFGLMIGDE